MKFDDDFMERKHFDKIALYRIYQVVFVGINKLRIKGVEIALVLQRLRIPRLPYMTDSSAVHVQTLNLNFSIFVDFFTSSQS